MDISEKNTSEKIVQTFISVQKSHTNSLYSGVIPLFLADRQYTSALKDDQDNLIKLDTTIRGQNVSITYHPTTIEKVDSKTGKTYTERRVPAGSEKKVLRAIIEMTIDNEAGEIPLATMRESNGLINIVFRLNHLYTYLQKKKMSMNWTQLKESLDIMSGSIVEASVQQESNSDTKNDTVGNKSAILQEVTKISSEDKERDGLYSVTLHRLISNDIKLGQYREIHESYFESIEDDSLQEYQLYDTLVQFLRHHFLNSDRKRPEDYPFSFSARELFIANGYIDEVATSTARRRLNNLAKLIKLKGVISDAKMFKKKLIKEVKVDSKGNPALDDDGNKIVQEDYWCTLVPTSEWAEGQYKANGIYNRKNAILESAHNMLDIK